MRDWFLNRWRKYLDTHLDLFQRWRFPIRYSLCNRVFPVFPFSIKRHLLQTLAETHDWNSHVATRNSVVLAVSTVQQESLLKHRASPWSWRYMLQGYYASGESREKKDAYNLLHLFGSLLSWKWVRTGQMDKLCSYQVDSKNETTQISFL